MENRNQTMIIGLLALIVGLIFGYFFGGSTMPHGEFFGRKYDTMHEHMYEHMMDDNWQIFMMEDDDARAYMLERMEEFTAESKTNQ